MTPKIERAKTTSQPDIVITNYQNTMVDKRIEEKIKPIQTNIMEIMETIKEWKPMMEEFAKWIGKKKEKQQKLLKNIMQRQQGTEETQEEYNQQVKTTIDMLSVLGIQRDPETKCITISYQPLNEQDREKGIAALEWIMNQLPHHGQPTPLNDLSIEEVNRKLHDFKEEIEERVDDINQRLQEMEIEIDQLEGMDSNRLQSLRDDILSEVVTITFKKIEKKQSKKKVVELYQQIDTMKQQMDLLQHQLETQQQSSSQQSPEMKVKETEKKKERKEKRRHGSKDPLTNGEHTGKHSQSKSRTRSTSRDKKVSSPENTPNDIPFVIESEEQPLQMIPPPQKQIIKLPEGVETPLRMMTGMIPTEIIYDTDVDSSSLKNCCINSKIIGKSKLVFVIYNTDGEIFGYYLHNVIHNKLNDRGDAGKSSFIFTLDCNHRLSGSLKKAIKNSYLAGYYLSSEEKEDLIEVGNIVLMKKERKYKSYCWQNPEYFDFENEEDGFLCGKTTPNEPFTYKRLLIIQME